MTTPPPWAHQQAVFDKTKDLTSFGIFAEPRTGKTRIVLMKAAWRYRERGLKTLVIFAPNGVHRNWVTDEIPKWHDPSIPVQCVVWRSVRAGTKKFEREMHALSAFKGLAVFAVNIDSVGNPKFVKYLQLLLRRGRAYGVVDESADIAKDSAARTKATLKLRDSFYWRDILDGTPGDESPLEYYTQTEFLKYGALGYTSFVSFKYRYAVIQKMPIPGSDNRPHQSCGGIGCPNCGYLGVTPGRTFDQIVGYKNQEELREKLRKLSVVIKRSDCKDLPPKIMGKRYYPLSPEQRRVYDEVSKHSMSQLNDGRVVTAAMVLTRHLRLQQIVHNFWPATEEMVAHEGCGGEGCELCEGGFVARDVPLTIIDPNNHPRLDVLEAELKRQPGQSIIWTTYHQDGDVLMGRLKDAVRYDGTVKELQRAENKRLFQKGDVRYWVGSSFTGGRGLDLSNAAAMFFYGHNYRLRVRRQAEDRGENLNKTVSTAVTDLVAEDTVDEDFLAAHERKINLAEFLMAGSGWRTL